VGAEFDRLLIVSAPTIPATVGLMQPIAGAGLLFDAPVKATIVMTVTSVTTRMLAATQISLFLSLRSGVVCRS